MDEQKKIGGEMRTFIRHPSDIPIEVSPEDAAANKEELLANVSAGGLCFRSDIPFGEGHTIKLRIAIVKPVFEARAKVVWCKKEDSHYDVGVEFVETKDAFKARMIEQVCHIEHYKKEIREKEGRDLSGKEAAMEWINKYAGTFQSEVLEKLEK
jgi:c-di-GMP-binding flagellar brake protein YcgR